MITNFKTISNKSRLWIYASESKIKKTNQIIIINKIENFLKNWEYHKKPLTSAVTICEDHFIVIALDDSYYGVGGCSIDSLQRIIQELENDFSLSLLNRLNVFCRINNQIICIPTFNLKELVNESTLFYDLTILKKSELVNYLKPIKDGWCKRFLN